MNSTVKKLCCAILLLLILCGCSNVITEDELIGGKWLVTNGYENEGIGGDPVCPSFDKGLEFIDEEKVYVIDEEKEFIYKLRESKEGMKISFFNPNGEMDFLKLLWKLKMHLDLMVQG